MTPTQLAKFETYSAVLLGWSRRLNLTRIFSRERIVRLHFLDSLACLTVFPASPSLRVVDVGTGAGFPGVPMIIARPDLRMTLVDASRRRVAFLELLIGELDLDVEVEHGRAEILSRKAEYREQFDLAVSRATAPLDRLIGLCLPFLRLEGSAVLPKGSRVADELASAAKAIQIAGGVVEGIHPIAIPGVAPGRSLVVLRKVRPTPYSLPRKSRGAGPSKG